MSSAVVGASMDVGTRKSVTIAALDVDTFSWLPRAVGSATWAERVSVLLC